MTIWKISPSELTFGFSCPACFYAKYKQGWQKPRERFPSVFGKLDRAMRQYWNGRSTSEFHPELPNGRLETTEFRPQSKEIRLVGIEDSIIISGSTDCVIHFSDHGYGVADFKTSQIKPELVQSYRVQLHCYAWAFENPGEKSTARFNPVRRLGLMVYEPGSFRDDLSMNFKRQWLEIHRDDIWFAGFLKEVLSILASDTPPTGKEKCEWCDLRRRIINAGH